jgi:hypothetical protein
MASNSTFKSAAQNKYSNMEDRHLTLGCEFECVLVQPKLEGKVTDSGENVLKNIFSEKFTL